MGLGRNEENTYGKRLAELEGLVTAVKKRKQNDP